MQFQEKCMIQTQLNSKKPHLWPDLGQNSGHHFFFQILAPSITRYHDQLSSCTISGKTNGSFLRKLSDR